MKNKYLVLLSIISPLTKKSQNKIWRSISAELEISIVAKIRNKINNLIKLWHAVVLVFLSILFIPLMPNATTIIDAQATGWDAILDGNELQINARNPMVVGKNKVCILWVKSGSEVLKVSILPDGGIKNSVLDKNIIDKLDGGMVMISIENKKDMVFSGNVEYSKQL